MIENRIFRAKCLGKGEILVTALCGPGSPIPDWTGGSAGHFGYDFERWVCSRKF